MTIAETLSAAWAVAGPFLGGGGVWAYLSSARKASSSAPAQIVAAAAHFQQALTAEAERLVAGLGARIQSLEASLVRLESDNQRLEARCDNAERAHDDCTAEVAGLKARLETAFREQVPAYEFRSPGSPP